VTGIARTSRDRILAAAAGLAEQIRTSIVRARDGSINWLDPKFVSREVRYQLVASGPHLYTGTAGVSLFLAAYAHLCDSGVDREISLNAIAPLRSRLSLLVADSARAASLKLGVGGFAGLGGFIYSFLCIGTLLGESALVDEAHALSTLLTDERIAADRDLDLTRGSAGAILALLALDRVRPGPNRLGETPLEIASRCARHLLRSRSSYEGRPRAWPWPGAHEGAPLTGFSHGAAGIGCALLKLWQRTGEAELREAALEGFEFERSLYSPEHRNWRDLRYPTPYFMTSWCHGAPGIALGRLAIHDLVDDPAIEVEIDVALATTRALGPTWIHQLCCGDMGRTEILSYAHSKLGEPALREEAEELIFHVLDRAEARGHFGWLPPGEAPLFSTSLFRGAAGVAYALVRFTHPQALPFPMLLE
jgi:type 2 lantibiotic biosynthesis protein LanM